MSANLILLTIGLPWLGSLLVWAAGDRSRTFLNISAVVFSFASAITSLALMRCNASEVALSFPMGTYFGNFSFAADGMGIFLCLVATIVGTLAIVFSIDYMHEEKQLARYYSFVLLFIGAMAGLVLTRSMLLLFFFWEITALCSYALISFYNDDPKAVAAGVKALIITQVGGLGLMIGALSLYAKTGSYDFDAFVKNSQQFSPALLAAMAYGALIAAAAKSAQFPFHTWLPDAMEAPTPVSALIHAATMVNAGIYLLARFYPVFSGVPYWRESVMLLGMLSALTAGIMALTSYDIKRVLAYSTVSQLGFMVYAVGTGDLFASQFHLMSHSLFKGLLFLGAGAVIHAVGTRDMREMGWNVGKQMPIVRHTFIIGSLALAGIPIVNGFWSKEIILESGFNAGPKWMFFVMLLCVVITACYTFRLVRLAFYAPSAKEKHIHDATAAMSTALIPLAFGVLTSWLLAGLFRDFLSATLPYHSVRELTLASMVHEICAGPLTWIALLLIALGAAAWWWKESLSWLTSLLKPIESAALAAFGFEAVNRAVAYSVSCTAEALRMTQPGLFSWNAMAIVLTLAVMLIILLF